MSNQPLLTKPVSGTSLLNDLLYVSMIVNCCGIDLSEPCGQNWGDWKCKRCGESYCQKCGSHINANTGMCEAYEDSQEDEFDV